MHELFLKLGYHSIDKIGPKATSSSILKELYARDHRILHLAGHGVYAPEEEIDIPCECCGARKIFRRITGMVIGPDQFLTPAQLHQMRAVPELVFINCCHLGRIEKVDDKLPPNHPPNVRP